MVKKMLKVNFNFVEMMTLVVVACVITASAFING